MSRYLAIEISIVFIIGLVNGQDTQTPLVKEAEYVYHPAPNWSDIFDWNLLKEFASEKKNVLFSPISLRIVLALLYQGAGDRLQSDFQNVLQFTNKTAVRTQYYNLLTSLLVQDFEKNGNALSMGSMVLFPLERDPEENFASAAKDFRTNIKPIDFSEPNSSDTINAWVRELTKGRITQLVQPEELKDLIVLTTNVLYFKGRWRYEFPNNQSFVGHFHLISDYDVLLLLRTVTVPFMTIEESFYYVEVQEYDSKMIRLHFHGMHYSMLIILPNSKGGVRALFEKINLQNVKAVINLMDKKRVKVTLPQFKLHFSKRLASTLEKFGMHQIFQKTTPPPSTVLSQYNYPGHEVMIDIIQKVGIEVDPSGEYVTTGNNLETVEAYFEATHPFLFFIEEEVTGSILLAGKLENPLEDSIPLRPFQLDD